MTEQKLPLYRCHKTVRAVKIKSVDYNPSSGPCGIAGATITPEDGGFEPFAVMADYVARHDPQPGGYFVEYSDGYCSYSPAEAFEQGYRLVEEDTQ